MRNDKTIMQISTRKSNNPINKNIDYKTADEVFNALTKTMNLAIGPVWNLTDEMVRSNNQMIFDIANVEGTYLFAVRYSNHTKTLNEVVSNAKIKPTFAVNEFMHPENFVVVYLFDRIISIDEHTKLVEKFKGRKGMPCKIDSFVGIGNNLYTPNDGVFTGNIINPDTLLNPTPTAPKEDLTGGDKNEVTNPETTQKGVTKTRLQIQSDDVKTDNSDVTPSNTSNLRGDKNEVTTYTLPEDNNTKYNYTGGYIPSHAHEKNEPVNEVEQSNGGYTPLTGYKQFDEEQITQDLTNMGVTEFAKFVKGIYPYYDRTEFAGRDYINTSNEDYLEIYREGKRVESTSSNGNTIVEFIPSLITGKKRTSLLYASCIIRRLINPNVGYAQLLANTVEDVVRYYDYTNDGVLCPREIARTVARVMMMTSKQLKAYPVKKDKRNIITNPELTNRKSAARIAKGDITNGVYARTYDDTKTDTQIASEMGVSDWTARNHRKRNNIPSKAERTREMFANLYDATLTNAQMIDKMRENGYNISLRTLQRLKQSLTASKNAHQSLADTSDKETIIQSGKTRENANMGANPVAQPKRYEIDQPSECEGVVCEPQPDQYGKTSPEAHQTHGNGQVDSLPTQSKESDQTRPESPTMAMEQDDTINNDILQLRKANKMYRNNDENASRLADKTANHIIRYIPKIDTVGKINWCRYYINRAFEQWGWVLESSAAFYLDHINKKLDEREAQLLAA